MCGWNGCDRKLGRFLVIRVRFILGECTTFLRQIIVARLLLLTFISIGALAEGEIFTILPENKPRTSARISLSLRQVEMTRGMKAAF
jgi:hypothetical protein